MRRQARRSRPIQLRALPQDIVIDGGTTAPIVIDMVNDFCAPDGWIVTVGVDVTPARAGGEPINVRFCFGFAVTSNDLEHGLEAAEAAS